MAVTAIMPEGFFTVDGDSYVSDVRTRRPGRPARGTGDTVTTRRLR